MKNIESRLSKIEKAAATTELVEVIFFKDNESLQMDLLKAINLFLNGEIHCIKSIWKPNEQKKYLSDTVIEIENYLNK